MFAIYLGLNQAKIMELQECCKDTPVVTQL